jgi:Flp pilus assembly protein TadG
MSTKHFGKSGQVTVEFIFVFPAFLILCLIVMEIGLIWADKHVLKLAAFEAARAVSRQNHIAGLHADEDMVYSGPRCLDSSAPVVS